MQKEGMGRDQSRKEIKRQLKGERVLKKRGDWGIVREEGLL